MKYKYDFNDRKKEKKNKIIFSVVFVIITIIIASFFFKNSDIVIVKKISDTIAYPFVFISNNVSSLFSNISDYFGDIKKANTDNNILNEENNKLKLKLLESQAILDENISLKKMLEINSTFQHFKLKSGRIIIREHDNFSQTFIINIGSKDGIVLNQAVIHKDGLVGYISNVNENTSSVTTILDPKTSVSVTISTINEPAILKGNLELKAKNNLKLEYIPIDCEISIGDMLYSSGLGSMFPSSIPVGKVITVINQKNDSDRYAIVEPCVNIRSISEVSVILE
ncbi:MAG: rod shape-determining protein MreC [Clostridia bacterium]